MAGVRAFRNNSGGVDIPVNNVIVLFDLLKIRGVTEPGCLVEVAEVAPEMRHVADAVAVAVENNGQVQNTVQGQPVEVTNVEGNVQGQPVVNQNVKQSHKKNKKNQKAVQANSEAKENVPAEVAPVVKEAPKAETKVETSKKAETKSESKGKEESSSSSNND